MNSRPGSLRRRCSVFRPISPSDTNPPLCRLQRGPRSEFTYCARGWRVLAGFKRTTPYRTFILLIKLTLGFHFGSAETWRKFEDTHLKMCWKSDPTAILLTFDDFIDHPGAVPISNPQIVRRTNHSPPKARLVYIFSFEWRGVEEVNWQRYGFQYYSAETQGVKSIFSESEVHERGLHPRC
ncbi:hypothetical protein BUALT_Bualt10G0100000 [Buddleja alternifolia]|uniref:Uncharacterized protein n=1 Tax=Buddleja alternifolia TaxID=168488 RepID=A0AAV6WYY7_9LAMI|nr:hypothetical protein BUALT_Bualt10G0100000 [Buddleja alternifolia]